MCNINARWVLDLRRWFLDILVSGEKQSCPLWPGGMLFFARPGQHWQVLRLKLEHPLKAPLSVQLLEIFQTSPHVLCCVKNKTKHVFMCLSVTKGAFLVACPNQVCHECCMCCGANMSHHYRSHQAAATSAWVCVRAAHTSCLLHRTE